MELPRIPAAPRPEDVLASGGVTSTFHSESGEAEEEEGEEYDEEEGEYEVPRSLSDRIGDWLEYRLELGRGRMEAEAPYREAEIAQKIARIEAHTDRETGLLAQQNKLRQAHVQANAARVAARGKSDAAGMGADKGFGKQSGAGRGGTNSSGRGSGSGGSSGNSGRTGGGSGRNPGGTNSSGSVGRGPGGSSGGRSGGGRGNESGGGPRGRQNSSHSSGGTGSGGGGRPTGSPRAERSRGRQERALARTAAREQRRGTAQAADLVERGKDRDQGRANRQATTEERRAARKARKEAAAADPGRVTLGEALGREAERRFDKRRQDEKAAREAKDKEAKDPKGPKVDLVKKPRGGTEAAAATVDPAAGAEGGAGASAGTGDPKVDLTKKPAAADGAEPDPGAAAGTPEGAAAETESAAAETASGGAETGPGGAEDPAAGDPPEAAAPGPAAETAADPGGEGTEAGGSPSEALGAEAPGGEDADRNLWERMASRLRGDAGPRARAKDSKTRGRKKPKSAPEPEPEETVTYEATFLHRPPSPPRTAPPADEEDYPDAEVVEPVQAALPRAPERHTQRPGTTRPTTEESSVKAEARPTYKGDSTPAKHRTNVTFDEFLTEIANIAVAAGMDQVEAVELAAALKDIADKLREMASDLVGDHNIATAVTDLIANLADQADAMKAQAQRCAQECQDAFEAALIVARSVARVYGEDMAEKEEAGLAQASAAVHHD